MSNQKNYSALQNVLPMMAGDIRVMKINMVKLVNLQSGTSRDKAKNFFDREAQKESLLESKMGKIGGTSPTRSSTSSGSSGSGSTKLFSISDFIKNIANMLIKGALVALGTFGLAKLLQSDDVRKTIKDFISKMFFTILEVIQKGAGLLTEFFKENGPEIREAIIKTFQAVVKLLVTAIESTANLLSDKRVWEGLWEIIQAIYAGIKKVLSTKINVAGEEVSLGTILGAVIIAFGALKGSVWLLKQAAEAAAKSLFSVGSGKGGRGIPEIPEKGGPQGGGDKGSSSNKQDKLERTRAGKEALDKIEKARLAKDAAELAKSGLRAGGVLAFLGLAGAEITSAAANNLSGMNDEQLDMLIGSGGGDDTALAAAIEKSSRAPTKTTAAANTTAPKQTSAKDPFNEAMVKGAKKAIAVAPGEMEKGLLDLIAEGESTSAGGYNAMNQGSIGKQILGSGNSEKIIGKKLTDMTVGEIMKRGEKKIGDGERVFAAGRYQIIPKTLKGLVTAGYISPNDKFDESTQDKLGMVLLQQRGLNKFKSGEMSAEEFQNSLALEWGSMANTSGTSSLGGPNVAMKGSGNKLAALLGGKVTPATQVASASSQNVPSAENSKTLIESMFDQLALFDEKILGGKLGISSVEMQNALLGIDKEFMNNPTFIDNSNNVSSTNMPPALASAVGASTWDREIANYYVDRVTYLE